jgi:Zn-dependent protease
MEFSGIRGLIAGPVILGLIVLFVSSNAPPNTRIVYVGVGAAFGFLAALILLMIDRLRRPRTEAISETFDAGPAQMAELPASFTAADPEADAEQPVAEDSGLDPFEVLVHEEVEKIRNPKTNWIQTLLILVVSLVMFIGLGMQNRPWAFTATLIGVLLLHELGHYLGMRYFGYRNVRMFFIPGFGAAVSGHKTSAQGYQEAIVTLLGPVPGLCLGVALLALLRNPAFGGPHRPELAVAANMLLLLNGFNLLPVFPLDGGRLLNQALFCRGAYLEAVFQILTVGVLIAYGWLRHQPMLSGVGIGFLMSVMSTLNTTAIARALGKQFAGRLPPMDGPIPPNVLHAIVHLVQTQQPSVKTAKRIAGVVFRVWERMHVQPPGLAATVALLLVYLGATLLGANVVRVRWIEGSVEHQLERFVHDWNQRLPRRIDEITRCDRVELGPGRSLSFVYTVSKDLPEEQKRKLTEDIRRRMLAASSLRPLFAAGVSMWHKYYDPTGNKLLEFCVKDDTRRTHRQRRIPVP